MYAFHYDAKKRLARVTYFPALDTYDVYSTYSRQLYNIDLDITYDDNDNAIKLTQSDIFRQGLYNVNTPSESYFWYDSTAWTIIDVTYDNKPSPFTASLKYWKFVQNDWGLATNSNWQAIITSLSPNNPLTIKYELYQGNKSSSSSTMTYNYTDKGYPSDSYTYQCQ